MKTESDVWAYQVQEFNHLGRPMPTVALAAITPLQLLVANRLGRFADLQPGDTPSTRSDESPRPKSAPDSLTQ